MAKHLLISGIVQGVGYRASFERQAQTLKLSGWVRNRRDSQVEALVAGDAAALAAIVEWARRGPPGACVDQVTIAEADDGQVTQGAFNILPTA